MEPPPLRIMRGTACLHMSIWLRRLTCHRPLPHLDGEVRHRGVGAEEVRIGQRRVVVHDVETAKARLGLGHGRRPPGPRPRGRPGTMPRHRHCPQSPRPRPDAAVSLMSTTSTAAPSRAKACAVAPPMPPPPPVTMATLPARRSMSPTTRPVGVAPWGQVEHRVAGGDARQRLGRPVRVAGRREAQHGQLTQGRSTHEAVPGHVLSGVGQRQRTEPVGVCGLVREVHHEPRRTGRLHAHAPVIDLWADRSGSIQPDPTPASSVGVELGVLHHVEIGALHRDLRREAEGHHAGRPRLRGDVARGTRTSRVVGSPAHGEAPPGCDCRSPHGAAARRSGRPRRTSRSARPGRAEGPCPRRRARTRPGRSTRSCTTRSLSAASSKGNRGMTRWESSRNGALRTGSASVANSSAVGKWAGIAACAATTASLEKSPSTTHQPSVCHCCLAAWLIGGALAGRSPERDGLGSLRNASRPPLCFSASD